VTEHFETGHHIFYLKSARQAAHPHERELGFGEIIDFFQKIAKVLGGSSIFFKLRSFSLI